MGINGLVEMAHLAWLENRLVNAKAEMAAEAVMAGSALNVNMQSYGLCVFTRASNSTTWNVKLYNKDKDA